MYKLYDEDFNDFPLEEFPYDKEHSALGEYHTFSLPGYSGHFYDPISLHQWRSKDGSWLVTSDGKKHYMEQNRADEVSGAFSNVYSLLMLKEEFYAPYIVEGMLELFDLSKPCGFTFLYKTSRNLYAFFFTDGKIKIVKRYDEDFMVLAEQDFKVEVLRPYYIKIIVKNEGVKVYIDDKLALTASVEFRVSRVGLISKVCARYHYLKVSMEDKDYESNIRKKALQEDFLRKKREQYAPLKLIHKIDLQNFGSGRQLRIARYNKQVYFVFAQHQKRVMRDSFARISCLTCLDLNGHVLWQKGEPNNDASHTLISCDLPFQITDYFGNGKLVVVYSMDFKIYVCDLISGEVLKEGLPPVIYNDPLVKNEPFYYLNLDGLRVADFEGLGYQGDLVVKDRYQNVWALDKNFNILWRYHHKNTGHFPYILDFNGDGIDEMFVGYDLVNSKGEIIWSAPYNSDHTDEIIFTNLVEKGPKYFVLASGNEGMNILDLNGNVYKHNEIGHAQRISVADYDLNNYGYEIITTAFWGSPGITRTYDYEGNILAEVEFISNGNLVSPVLYDGINSLCLLNASLDGGLLDANLDIVVKFPQDNHPYLCSEVFDIDGDGIDEILCWDQKELWIYKASKWSLPKFKYKRYPENAFSNYRGEYLVIDEEN